MATHPTSPDFLTTALQIMDVVLAHPKSILQTGVSVGALVLAIGLLFPKIASAFDAKNVSDAKGWLMAALAPAGLLSAATAIQIYVLPSVLGAGMQKIVLIGGVVLAFLLVVVPLTKLVFTCPFIGGLLICSFTFICAAVAVLLIHLSFDALAAGERTAGAIQQRSKDMKEQGVQ